MITEVDQVVEELIGFGADFVEVVGVLGETLVQATLVFVGGVVGAHLADHVVGALGLAVVALAFVPDIIRTADGHQKVVAGFGAALGLVEAEGSAGAGVHGALSVVAHRHAVGMNRGIELAGGGADELLAVVIVHASMVDAQFSGAVDGVSVLHAVVCVRGVPEVRAAAALRVAEVLRAHESEVGQGSANRVVFVVGAVRHAAGVGGGSRTGVIV